MEAPAARVFLNASRSRSGSIVQAFALRPCDMEPAPKRCRLGYERQAFIFQCTTPHADGTLYKPHVLQLVVNNDTNQVICDRSQPHGTWVQLPDALTITFHYAGGPMVKTSVFRPITGTDSWLQVNCGSPWQGVLIPFVGTLETFLMENS